MHLANLQIGVLWTANASTPQGSDGNPGVVALRPGFQQFILTEDAKGHAVTPAITPGLHDVSDFSSSTPTADEDLTPTSTAKPASLVVDEKSCVTGVEFQSAGAQLEPGSIGHPLVVAQTHSAFPAAANLPGDRARKSSPADSESMIARGSLHSAGTSSSWSETRQNLNAGADSQTTRACIEAAAVYPQNQIAAASSGRASAQECADSSNLSNTVRRPSPDQHTAAERSMSHVCDLPSGTALPVLEPNGGRSSSSKDPAVSSTSVSKSNPEEERQQPQREAAAHRETAAGALVATRAAAGDVSGSAVPVFPGGSVHAAIPASGSPAFSSQPSAFMVHVPNLPVGQRSADTMPQSSVSSALERMDSAHVPQVVGSTAQRLSVGVQEPGLGWIEVRAHATSGQISAAVAASSSSAHATLSMELPAMRNYLAAQQVRVDHLASETFSPFTGGRQNSSGKQASGEDREANSTGAKVSLPGNSSVNEFPSGSFSYISVRV